VRELARRAARRRCAAILLFQEACFARYRCSLFVALKSENHPALPVISQQAKAAQK